MPMSAKQFTAACDDLFGTQVEAAHYLGVTQPTICVWRNGSRTVPKPIEGLLFVLKHVPRAKAALRRCRQETKSETF
jgi:hypothetical protein